MLKLIIMGAPGSGKGTISKKIVNELNLEFLSSGDLLRNEITSKSDVGKECEGFIRGGKLVPDKLVERVLFKKLSSFKSGWLMDGYPRKVTQATELYHQGHKPDLVIDLRVPFDEIIKRLKDRWVHIPSGRVYNLQYNSPKVPGKDDLTGEELVQRDDDLPDTVLKRLKHYEEQTLPVAHFFKERKKLVCFEGRQSDVIWPQVQQCLRQHQTKSEMKL